MLRLREPFRKKQHRPRLPARSARYIKKRKQFSRCAPLKPFCDIIRNRQRRPTQLPPQVARLVEKPVPRQIIYPLAQFNGRLPDRQILKSLIFHLFSLSEISNLKYAIFSSVFSLKSQICDSFFCFLSEI